MTVWHKIMKTPTYTSGAKIDMSIEPNVVKRDITRYVLLSYTHENGRRCAPNTIAKSMSIASGFCENAHITMRR